MTTQTATQKIDQGKVVIALDECKGCSLCVDACPPKVLRLSVLLNRQGYHPVEYLGSGCTGCGICFYMCPEPGALTVYKWVEEGKALEKLSANAPEPMTSSPPSAPVPGF